MIDSVNIKEDFNPLNQSKPVILDLLPDPSLSIQVCPPGTTQQLDLILLAIEALELGASENMLKNIKELELQSLIANRVHLWRLRCTNPWRRSYNRDVLSLDRGKALALIVNTRAKQLSVLIRQLILAEQQMKEKGLPVQHHFRLSEYLERFQAHFRSRMNPRRTKVANYLASEHQLNELALFLLNKLLFCTGTKGLQRFWISLFDGEVP